MTTEGSSAATTSSTTAPVADMVTPTTSPNRAAGITSNPQSSSVAAKAAWLQNAFNKSSSPDKPSSTRDLSAIEASHIVTDRKRWLEEEAFVKHLEERGVDTATSSHAHLVEERKKWLDEQAEKNRLENEKNTVVALGSPRSVVRGGSSSAIVSSDDADDDNIKAAADASEEGDEDDEVPERADESKDTADEKEEADVAVAAEEGKDESSQEKDVATSEVDGVTSELTPTPENETSVEKDASPPPQDLPAGSAAMPCLFSSPVFADQRDQMEFFLPAACSCAKCREECPADTDPTSLQTILRPWQVEFLESEGITTAQQLVDAEKGEERHHLCKRMKRWRRKKELPVKSISCLMACRIWAKTAEEALKNAEATADEEEV